MGNSRQAIHEIIEMDVLSESEQGFRNARRVLEAGIWLIRNGWGKMQLLPYDAPSGCAWRCAFYPPGRPSQEFYRYSTASGHKFLADHCGGTVSKTITAKNLANAIIKSVPTHLARKCYGEAQPETLRWMTQLEDALNADKLPVAFSDGCLPNPGYWFLSPINDSSTYMASQPGYTKPGIEPQWFESDFWRGVLGDVDTLNNSDSCLLAFAYDDKIEQIAHEMKAAMDESNDDEIPRIFKSAIAKLWLTINPEDYDQ